MLPLRAGMQRSSVRPLAIPLLIGALSACQGSDPSDASSVDPTSSPDPTGTEAPWHSGPGTPTPPGAEPDGSGLGALTSWGPLNTLAPTHFMDVTRWTGFKPGHGFVDDYYTTGQAFGDYDGDGWQDLYVTDSRGLNMLYHNNRNGTFSASPFLSQVALDEAISGGALFADYDNDGDQDLFVLNLGPNVMFRNDGARGFTDVTEEAGLADPGKGQSAAFGDFDNDGDLDLYVVNWWCVECEGNIWQQNTDRLYENLGDGRFADITFMLREEFTDGAGYSAAWVDYDSDGDLDIYVANDKGFDGPRQPDLPFNHNVLFRNDGPGCEGWCFVEASRTSGADLRMEGMGLAVADFDQDMDLDIFVTNTGQPKLLVNQGNQRFEERALEVGLRDDATTWGAAFFDYDNDGDLDLYASVGVSFGLDNANRLFDNQGDGTFISADAHSGAAYRRHSIGVAVADFNQDGGLDLVVGGTAQGYRAFGNLAATRAGHNWTRVRLRGGGPVNRDAVGARVYLIQTNGRTQMAEVQCGASHGAGHDMAVHFGLGEAEVAELQVRWPDGTRELIEDVPLNTEWTHRHPAD